MDMHLDKQAAFFFNSNVSLALALEQVLLQLSHIYKCRFCEKTRNIKTLCTKLKLILKQS